jgi:hypothetical protein
MEARGALPYTQVKSLNPVGQFNPIRNITRRSINTHLNVIFPCVPRAFQVVSLPFGFPANILYAFLVSLIRAKRHTHPIMKVKTLKQIGEICRCHGVEQEE